MAPSHESLVTSHGPQDTFLQNKPNFPKTKMHIILYQETAYENIAPSNNPKNKPNSNPIFNLCFHPRAHPGAWVSDLPFVAPAKNGPALSAQTASPAPSHGSRATSHDFTKQTQFSKCENNLKPIPAKNL